jgi:hypothetical protein
VTSIARLLGDKAPTMQTVKDILAARFRAAFAAG